MWISGCRATGRCLACTSTDQKPCCLEPTFTASSAPSTKRNCTRVLSAHTRVAADGAVVPAGRPARALLRGKEGESACWTGNGADKRIRIAYDNGPTIVRLPVGVQGGSCIGNTRSLIALLGGRAVPAAAGAGCNTEQHTVAHRLQGALAPVDGELGWELLPTICSAAIPFPSKKEAGIRCSGERLGGGWGGSSGLGPDQPPQKTLRMVDASRVFHACNRVMVTRTWVTVHKPCRGCSLGRHMAIDALQRRTCGGVFLV